MQKEKGARRVPLTFGESKEETHPKPLDPPKLEQPKPEPSCWQEGEEVQGMTWADEEEETLRGGLDH